MDKFPLFQATQSVVIYCGSPEKLTHVHRGPHTEAPEGPGLVSEATHGGLCAEHSPRERAAPACGCQEAAMPHFSREGSNLQTLCGAHTFIETSDFPMLAQMVFHLFCSLFAVLNPCGPGQTEPSSPFCRRPRRRSDLCLTTPTRGPGQTHAAIDHTALLPPATPHSLLSPGDTLLMTHS